MPRPSWDEYFLSFAITAAARSNCLRVPAGVGAVLVKDHQILSTGYAGSLRGQPHCTDVGCLIDSKTGGCVRTVHAEMNSILQAATHGVCIEGATCYCTLSPCWDCFKALVNGGIDRIVYSTEYRVIERQREFSQACGVLFEHHGIGKYTGETK
jgi:dCMP deaminase